MEYCKYCFTAYSKNQIQMGSDNPYGFQCENCFAIDPLKELLNNGGKCLICKKVKIGFYYKECLHSVCETCRGKDHGSSCGLHKCPLCKIEQKMRTPIYKPYKKYFYSVGEKIKKLLRVVYAHSIHDLKIKDINKKEKIMICMEYHKWLVLLTENKDKKLAPPKIIDIVWRHSILDMEIYERMCKLINGELIYYNEHIGTYTKSYYNTITTYMDRYTSMITSWYNMTPYIWSPKYKIRRNGMQIFIKGLTGKTHPLSFNSDDKIIFVLLSFIQEADVGIGRFTYSGRTLETNKTFKEMNIKKESTLHFTMGLRGC